MILCLLVFFVGISFPHTVGREFENDYILQSVLKEIEKLKIDYKAEVDELKHQINELREQNRDLVTTVNELLQEEKTLDQFGNGNKVLEFKELKSGHVDSRAKAEPKLATLNKQLDLGQPVILKRQVPSDGRVAFTAGLSAGIPHLGPHQTVIFDNAVTNLGMGYHSNSGIFIAPVKGAYVFNVKMKVPPRNKLHLQLVVDGNQIFDLGVEIPSSDEYESANELFIVEVNQGADVFVRADSVGGNLYGYMRSLFSGFLLFETE